MCDILNTPPSPPPWTELNEDAARQYIDARASFSGWQDARRQAASLAGGMFWKRQGERECLSRTGADGSQKSLGRRAPETEAIYKEFTERKEMAEIRLKGLTAALVRDQRMNKALYVGQAPHQLIDALSSLPANAIATSNHDFAGQAAVTFIWSAIPARTEWRYGEASYKVMALDAGHVCQNLYLACEAIGAGACAIAAYNQTLADELLGLDGDEEYTVNLAPVGKIGRK
jgi:nitroreductase